MMAKWGAAQLLNMLASAFQDASPNAQEPLEAAPWGRYPHKLARCRTMLTTGELCTVFLTARAHGPYALCQCSGKSIPCAPLQ